MFCSEKCCEETYKKFNRKEDLIKDSLRGSDIRQKMMRIMNESLNAVGGFENLQKLFSSVDRETVFDLDFSDPDDENLKRKVLTCIATLLPKTNHEIVKYVESSLNIPSGSKKDFFVSFLSRIILNNMRNGLKVPYTNANLQEDGMLLPFVSLMNHSCDPNTYCTFIENKCCIFVIKPILAGEEVFSTYR